MDQQATPLPGDDVDDALPPYHAAYLAYHAEPPGLDWGKMVLAHFESRNAWFISTPSSCVAARLVNSRWSGSYVLDPERTVSKGDMLHVYVAAGDLGELVAMIPPALLEKVKWISFQKRGYAIHRLPMEKVTKPAIREASGCRHASRHG